MEVVCRGRPVDVHLHGIGPYDFSDLEPSALPGISALLEARGMDAVLTVFLRLGRLEQFERFMAAFAEGRRSGTLKGILGISIEGPLLSSSGGIPRDAVWVPTRAEWNKIAKWGRHGLLYVIIAPDYFGPDLSSGSPSVSWIIESLQEAHVLPSFGHFAKDSPQGSAVAVESALGLLAAQRTEERIVAMTDHIFNDMPRSFRHAWRSTADRESRERDLEEINNQQWSAADVCQKLGPVPGTLIIGALRGLVGLCVNFDGDHVDMVHTTRLVQNVGAGRIFCMTDTVSEGNVLCGEELLCSAENSLLYRPGGCVAAGTTSVDLQIRNILAAGVSVQDCWRMASGNGTLLFATGAPAGSGYTHLRADGSRWYCAVE
jgi:N-acetylglucosamine-6-phosphate deacetylase